MEETKKCKCCGRELPLSEFNRSGGGFLNTCKECVAIKKKEGREKKRQERDFEQEIANAKKMRLSDFTPMDLMEELARRGIEGTMRIPETIYKEVNLKTFLYTGKQ
jgi:ribosome-binding protein aMBF1 (putative translation factor)